MVSPDFCFELKAIVDRTNGIDSSNKTKGKIILMLGLKSKSTNQSALANIKKGIDKEIKPAYLKKAGETKTLPKLISVSKHQIGIVILEMAIIGCYSNNFKVKILFSKHKKSSSQCKLL